VRDTLRVVERLPELRVPARVVWGAADPFQRVEYGERLAWDLRAELVRLEGARHFVPEDHPEEIARELAALVEAASG
jgi:pimeloyl-ACP methyl ester carboxylesterase